jgi:3-methyladenine DNA glycosylase/8-oxoguanine DNA glycosylase
MKSPFAYDPAAAIAHLRVADAALGRVIDRVGPFAMKIRTRATLFEALLRSITSQQLHGSAAAAIYARVEAALVPLGGTTPEAFDQVPDTMMRAAGLSANKLLAARDLALKCRDKTIPTLKEARLFSDEEIISRLVQVRGIGTWTAHILLIFYLGRPDVLPTGDYSVRLAFKKLYHKRKDPRPEVMVKYARRWQPYRSVASWYLWRSLELD